jgi:DNA-binding transcriptional ArsR family regulator
VNGDDTRFKVLMCLIDATEKLTLSEISRRLDMPHQLVSYHLPILEDMGLIIKQDGGYFCQPAHIDPDLLKLYVEANLDPVLETLPQLYLDFDEEKDRVQALYNNLQIMMALAFDEIRKLIDPTE